MEEEQRGETPKKKLRIDDDAKPMGENAKNDEANLAEMTENEEKMPGTSLPLHGTRLPLELECEMYKFLSLPIQQKFLAGMGRGIYGYFGPRIRALIQAKRIAHPAGNRWNNANTRDVQFTPNRLQIMGDILIYSESVYAERGFLISPKFCRKDRFPGIIINYFEVTQKSSHSRFYIGLSGKFMDGKCVGKAANSFAIKNNQVFPNFCFLSSGTKQHIVSGMPAESIKKPYHKGLDVIFGCGILLEPKDKMSIFFTRNGTVLGRKIPFKVSAGTGSRLYPTVTMMNHMILEANFGDDLDEKPFSYDIKKCPGLGFE